jgi:starvation-inducible outer membrane lipoprotein
MRRNKDLRNPETIGIMLIVMIIILCVLTGCISIPDVCQQGVPTNKNCFNLQGNKGGFGFGPIHLFDFKFD